MSIFFYCHSIAASNSLAQSCASVLRPGDVVGLNGPLGAGKTEFVRHAAIEQGCDPDDICSPTFVLENIYCASSKNIQFIHHWDLYRLVDDELVCQLQEIIEGRKAVIFVEWAERLAELQDLLSVKISLDCCSFAGQQARMYSFDFRDKSQASALESLLVS